MFSDKNLKAWKRLKKKGDSKIKDVRSVFRLKTERNGTTIKDIRNLFMLGKEIHDTTKNRKRKTIKTVRNLFEPEEEENYYKPVRVGNL